jgi:hypothetical protein
LGHDQVVKARIILEILAGDSEEYLAVVCRGKRGHGDRVTPGEPEGPLAAPQRGNQAQPRHGS